MTHSFVTLFCLNSDTKEDSPQERNGRGFGIPPSREGV